MANRFDRITSDAARMNGQPSIRGMRLTVRRVVEAAALYPDREALRREYPELGFVGSILQVLLLYHGARAWPDSFP